MSRYGTITLIYRHIDSFNKYVFCYPDMVAYSAPHCKIIEKRFESVRDVSVFIDKNFSWFYFYPLSAISYYINNIIELRIKKQAYAYACGYDLKKNTLALFEIEDCLGRKIMQEEAREALLTAPQHYRYRKMGRKSTGYRRGYGSSEISSRKRSLSSKQQDFEEMYRVKCGQDPEHWGHSWYEGKSRGQRTGWKCHRKTQYRT